MTGRGSVPQAVPVVPVPGAGLVLGPWSDDDVDAVVVFSADPECRAWSPSMRAVHTRDDALAWLVSRAGAGRVDWAVRDAASGVLVGRVGLHALDPEQRTAEIGYAVMPGWRGRGVARAAVAAATQHAFGQLGLARLTLVHAVGNGASCAVARAAGYAFEGVERSALDHGDGVRHDVHRHARLVDDPVGASAEGPPSLVPVELVAGVLQLRPWEHRHVGAVLAASADPEIRRWNDPQVPDEAAAHAWVDRARDWGGHATWAVHDATTGEVLGNVSLHRIEPAHARGEVGFWVLPTARGRGVGAAAVDAVVRYAFGALGLQRVEAYHAVDNGASCRLCERAGLGVEGVLRSSYRYGDGRLHDEHLHARLSPSAPTVQ